MEISAGELREFIGGYSPTSETDSEAAFVKKTFEGRKALIRAKDSGVHVGLLLKAFPGSVLIEGRRLWAWKCNSGFTLSGLVEGGIDLGHSKISPTATLMVFGVCEIILVEDEFHAHVMEAKPHEPE